MLRHSPDATSLDALKWHHPHLPEHVTVHCATTAQLAGLGWIDPHDGDLTGAKGLLARAVAQQFETHHSRVVLHPAMGHANPQRARPASAEVLAGRTANTSLGQVWTSVSRCAPVIVVATALTPVGIDIETLQTPRQATELVTLLHPHDQRALGALRQKRLVHEVTAAWTRKEAMLKALGTGLLRDPALDVVGTQRHPAQPDGWSSLSAPLNTVMTSYYLGLAWRTRA